MNFLDAESAPVVKAAVHGAVLALGVIVLTYNACAWYRRPSKHLAVNVAAFAGLCVLEVANIVRHARDNTT